MPSLHRNSHTVAMTMKPRCCSSYTMCLARRRPTHHDHVDTLQVTWLSLKTDLRMPMSTAYSVLRARDEMVEGKQEVATLRERLAVLRQRSAGRARTLF